MYSEDLGEVCSELQLETPMESVSVLVVCLGGHVTRTILANIPDDACNFQLLQRACNVAYKIWG